MLRQDIDPFKVSSPRIFLVRMLVFLVIGALLVVILNRQIWAAFLANPGLNALIIGVLLIGILLAFRQVVRLFPEIAWVNSFRLADPGLGGGARARCCWRRWRRSCATESAAWRCPRRPCAA